MEVPPEVADELIASGQAEAADREVSRHELVEEEKGDEELGCDEAEWALDEAITEVEDQGESESSKQNEN